MGLVLNTGIPERQGMLAVYVERQGKRVVGVILGAITTKALVRKMSEMLDKTFADSE